jgi:serine/threonine-protein kinase
MGTPQQRYRVLERIAAGGMAEVYRAESAGLEGFKKTVAIKRVLPHLSEKKQFIGMFLDEARLSATLSHSNCVQVFDIGVGENTYFIVMEYVDGADLKAIIEYHNQHKRRIPVEVVCFICLKICEGLSYAHEVTDAKGRSLHIVHRDMSPPNVLITRRGEVKVVDFGLAKANSQLERSAPGIIKGKFSYLSPEAARGEDVDSGADIFAVGIMLWEMLAGRRLFLGDTDLQTVRMVQAANVPSIVQLNPDVPPSLERVIAKALAKNRSQRYQTARDLGRDLNTILFELGKAVSSFDISQLVIEAVAERDRKKGDHRTDKSSLIGSLIDDAMMEFTSLHDESGGSPLGKKAGGVQKEVGSSPLDMGSFEDVQDWATDLGLDPPESRPAYRGREYAVGNLAALEDSVPPEAHSSRPGASKIPPVPPQMPLPRTTGPASSAKQAVPVRAPVSTREAPVSGRTPSQRSPGHQSRSKAPPAPKKASRAGIIAIACVALLLLIALAAYFLK